jgi:UPF0271 protein
MQLDLNCDLGEGEPLSLIRALMRYIGSANVACGGHAGSLETMSACLRLAKKYKVRLGAHPGPWDREGFGRKALEMDAEELELLLLHQVSALEAVARSAGIKLHHIKLHGALYHATESDERLARCYVATVARWWPRAKIYAAAGGRVAQRCRLTKVEVWEEIFADRAYRNDGSLVPRHQPGAVISDLPEVLGRVERLLACGEIRSISGKRLEFHPQTLCVHSDTTDAGALARALAKTCG